jgi:hypothetical protein
MDRRTVFEVDLPSQTILDRPQKMDRLKKFFYAFFKIFQGFGTVGKSTEGSKRRIHCEGSGMEKWRKDKYPLISIYYRFTCRCAAPEFRFCVAG